MQLQRIIVRVVLVLLTLGYSLEAQEHVPFFKAIERYPATCNQEDVAELTQLLEKLRGNELPADGKKRLTELILKVPNGCLSKNQIFDATQALRWLRRIPCSPEKLLSEMTISISGEAHGSQPIPMMKKLIERARNKKLVVGFEYRLEEAVLPIGEEAPNVMRRVDGEVPWRYLVLFEPAGLFQAGNKFSDSPDFLSALAKDKRGESLAMLFAEIAVDPKQPPSIRTAAELWGDAYKLHQESVKSKGTDDLLKKKMIEKDKALRDVSLKSDKFGEQIVKVLERKALDHLEDTAFRFANLAPSLGKTLPQKEAGVWNDEAIKSFREQVVSNWRDREMAHAAAALLCKAAQENISEVHLHVGADHVRKVFDEINQILKASQIEKQVSLRVEVSNLAAIKDYDDAAWLRKLPDAHQYTFGKD